MSLNPCCSGQWSRTFHTPLGEFHPAWVLILVVVEDGLVQEQQNVSADNVVEVSILIVVNESLERRTANYDYRSVEMS